MFYDLARSRDLFAEMDGLTRRLDAFFGAGGLSGGHGLTAASRALFPQLRVTEAEDAFVVTGDLPGLDPDTLELTAEGDVLVLRGASDQAEPEGFQRLRAERRPWRFERSLRFARPIDADRVSAKLTNGVLTVTVPLRTPTTITVSVEGA